MIKDETKFFLLILIIFGKNLLASVNYTNDLFPKPKVVIGNYEQLNIPNKITELLIHGDVDHSLVRYYYNQINRDLKGLYNNSHFQSSNKLVLNVRIFNDVSLLKQHINYDGGINSEQVYSVVIHNKLDTVKVELDALNSTGLSYSFSLLEQLLTYSESEPLLPKIKIIDWPSIDRRLFKVSGTNNHIDALEYLIEWLPIFKINLFAMQFHGDNSKKPQLFVNNVLNVLHDINDYLPIDIIIYFSPFKGGSNGAFDFTNQKDRKTYIGLLKYLLDNGLSGVEIDYNDWPDFKVPQQDVINFVTESISDYVKYILYCPPSSGNASYKGLPSNDFINISKSISNDIYILWTGEETIIRTYLKVDYVNKWIRMMHRKPFLWVNRVYPGAIFSDKVQSMPEAYVFKGEYLPKKLDEYFSGIHLNVGLSKNSALLAMPEDVKLLNLVYLATAADFLWNSEGWDPEGSFLRSYNFVKKHFKTNRFRSSNSFNVEDNNNPLKNVICFPNPARDYTTIYYNVQEETAVDFYIYNVKGQIIYNSSKMKLFIGSRYQIINTSEYSNGIYFFSFYGDGFTESGKFTIIK